MPVTKMLLAFLALLFLLAACEEAAVPIEEIEEIPDAGELEEGAGALNTGSGTEEASNSGEEAEKELLSCTYTSECAEGKECVNGKCLLLTDLYSSECEQKCTIKNVTVSTSDGGLPETYKPGQGSYTAAGGLAWNVLRVPEHCPAEAPLAAFQLTYKTTGKVLGESIVTVAEGQESEVITHPALPSVKFKLKVDEVEMEC